MSQAGTQAHVWLYLQEGGCFRSRHSTCLQLLTTWEKHAHTSNVMGEKKILMVGALLALPRDAAWHHPRADQTYLVHGKCHTRHFPNVMSCWQPECQRVSLSSVRFMPLA